MIEVWRQVKGFPRYEVSNTGRVKSYCRKLPRFLKLNTDKHGYKTVTLFSIEHKTKFVHSLVAEAFISDYPEGKVVNHKNGIKGDNRLENLEFVTASENQVHAITAGLKKLKISDKQVRIIRYLLNAGLNCTQIAPFFNVSINFIWEISTGKARRRQYHCEHYSA